MNSLSSKEEIIYLTSLESKENRNIEILFLLTKIGKAFQNIIAHFAKHVENTSMNMNFGIGAAF